MKSLEEVHKAMENQGQHLCKGAIHACFIAYMLGGKDSINEFREEFHAKYTPIKEEYKDGN
jgi:hypothetical protein